MQITERERMPVLYVLYQSEGILKPFSLNASNRKEQLNFTPR